MFADAVEVAVALVAPPRDEKAHVPVERHWTAERAFERVGVQIDAGRGEEEVIVPRHIIRYEISLLRPPRMCNAPSAPVVMPACVASTPKLNCKILFQVKKRRISQDLITHPGIV